VLLVVEPLSNGLEACELANASLGRNCRKVGGTNLCKQDKSQFLGAFWLTLYL